MPPPSWRRSSAAFPTCASKRSAARASKPRAPRCWIAWSATPSWGSSRPCRSCRRISGCWPAFRAAAERVRAARPNLQVVVAGTPRGRYPAPGDIVIHTGDPLPVFAAADAGLCKSGTTTLEAALADLPMVVAYRLNPVSNFIATRVLRVPWVGLVNLIAGYEVTPEFLQRAAHPDALAEAVRPLLDPTSAAARHQREGLAR